MGHRHSADAARDSVRCLACRTVYAKPVGVEPGEGAACPRCGYVGWLRLPRGGARALHPRGPVQPWPR